MAGFLLEKGKNSFLLQGLFPSSCFFFFPVYFFGFYFSYWKLPLVVRCFLVVFISSSAGTKKVLTGSEGEGGKGRGHILNVIITIGLAGLIAVGNFHHQYV